MKLLTILNELFIPYETMGDMTVDIEKLVASSREKCEKGLFFCVKGLRFDAHDFADQAAESGCVALVVERFLPSPLPQVKVENVRSAMAFMACAFYRYPSQSMTLVGITGTKGKTTTSYLTKAILEKGGMKVGLIGTTGSMIGSRVLPSTMTTPDPIELQDTLRQMADEGVQAVVMEVSAHAIDMHRLDGLSFEAAAYTNFSHDHLDYFHTMESYFEAKKSFFTGEMVRNGAFNADEETSEAILKEFCHPKLTYGISADADVYARDIDIMDTGVAFRINIHSEKSLPIKMHLTGMFNIYNALCAASLAAILGISDENIRKGLESVTRVPGRVEVLDTRTPYKVILDYAHAPDALSNILSTIRPFTKKRLIVLVGCGGDRDREKRPIMGQIVGRMADFSILTSDNPRSEDPYEILDAIEEGIRKTKGEYTVIENRREAIRYALQMGREGDIIVLAGKGNETYQEIMGVKHPFDEKIVVAELLKEMAQE